METSILYPHISLNVSNVEGSVTFYKAFFGTSPFKERPGYAKFQLDNPKLNFTLNESHDVVKNSGVLNHLGFQVATTDDVLLTRLRLKSAGLATADEMKTTCCYSVQDKIWTKDPDGNSWEVFTVLADAGAYSESAEGGVCCTPVSLTSEQKSSNVKD